MMPDGSEEAEYRGPHRAMNSDVSHLTWNPVQTAHAEQCV